MTRSLPFVFSKPATSVVSFYHSVLFEDTCHEKKLSSRLLMNPYRWRQKDTCVANKKVYFY